MDARLALVALFACQPAAEPDPPPPVAAIAPVTSAPITAASGTASAAPKRAPVVELLEGRTIGDTTCSSDDDCTVTTEPDDCCVCCPAPSATSKKWLKWWLGYRPQSCTTTCPPCDSEEVCVRDDPKLYRSVCVERRCQLAHAK